MAERKSPLSIHFVGSVPLSSTEEVFTTLSSTLPPGSLKRIPDGETGERHYFVHWQRLIFAKAGVPEVLMDQLAPDGFRLDHTDEEINKTMANFPQLETGYDTEAINSYAVFRRLRDSGVIPKDVKFQVGIPTAAQVVLLFVQPAFQAHVAPHYEAALLRALRNIQSQIPHEDLAIQFDLAMEYPLLEGVLHNILPAPMMFLPIDDKVALKKVLVKGITKLVNAVEDDVELGFHMCYGDFQKQHFVEPKDTGIIVDLTLTILSEIKHAVSWLHFPVPKDRTDEAYLTPLHDLLPKLDPSADIYVGLVIEDDPEGTRARLATAKKFFGTRAFGISTECGLGRRVKDDLDSVVEIEKDVAVE